MENFRIESLEINKIGAFEHIKMDFPKKTDPEKAEIHILTGENGTGKSTVLMLLTNVADNSNEQEIFKRIKLRDSENPNKFSIRYGDRKEMTRVIMKGHYTPPYSLQNSEILNLMTPVNYAFFAYSGNRFAKEELINAGHYQLENPFKDALNFIKSIDHKQLSIWILSNKTNALIANENGDFESKNTYEKNIQKIESIITEIINQEIKFVLQTRPTIRVEVKLSGVQLSIDSLPDGIKSIISWIGDLVRRLETMSWIGESNEVNNIFDRNFILFLDEIEVHLHPAWQRKILPVVQKLFKNAQIFISTHSPFVVGSVDGAWVHKLKKDGAYAVLDGEPILSEDAESYETILEEVFGIKERFGDEIENKLVDFRKYTREILSGDESNFHRWEEIIEFFKNQRRPDEIMSLISPQIRQINRILKQVSA